MGQTIGTGDYQYEEVEDWAQVQFEGVVSDMATDSQDRVYLAVRTTQAIDDNTGVVLVLRGSSPASEVVLAHESRRGHGDHGYDHQGRRYSRQ